MTINLFLALLLILSAVTALLTEAIKKAFDNAKKDISPNLIALINAIIVGIGGTAMSFAWLSIPFTIVNIFSILTMAFCIWIGSMIGFDKVIQLIEQIRFKK